MRRPSPAIVISIIALVVACTAPATARVLITSRDVKDRSLRGRDIRPESLGGRQIKGLSGRDIIRNGLDGSDIDEGTLDPVPNATRARTADALKGVRVGGLGFRALASMPATTIYDEAGLRLQAACDASGGLTLTAVPTTAGGGVLRVEVTHPGSPAETTLVTDNLFQGSDTANLLSGGADNASGRLTYAAPGGDVATISYLAQSGVDRSRGFQCLVAGTQIHSLP